MAKKIVDITLYNDYVIDLDSMEDKKHLCECGCGDYTKPGNKYIYWHYRPKRPKGIPHTEETKRKISEANKGKIRSEEAHKKMLGRIPWNKGIPRTQEVKDAISKKNKGRKFPPMSEEARKKMSEDRKGKKFTDKHRANIKKSWTPERREKLSQKKKQEWQEGVFNNVKTTSSSYEYKIAPLMGKLGFQNTLEENYWVNGKDKRRKVPDFYNKETKEIVELWGTYFHRRQILPEGQRHETEEEVISWYAEAGWNCRIIWIEEEFDNYYNEILEEVKNNG